MNVSGIKALEQTLAYKFLNEELISEALTHRSFRHESGHHCDNERMEFLGDAVLDLCVSQVIMKIYPDKREGELSRIRSGLVSENHLNKIASQIGLGEVLLLGNGEERSGGRERPSILADTLEAVLAAVYLDGGLIAVTKIIKKLWQLDEKDMDSQRVEGLISMDAKSRLQEVFQSHGFAAPTYSCLRAFGPEHDRVFTMGLMVHSVELCRAKGSTKKEATQKAAFSFLEKLNEPMFELNSYLAEKKLLPQRKQKKTVSVKRTKSLPITEAPQEITP